MHTYVVMLQECAVSALLLNITSSSCSVYYPLEPILLCIYTHMCGSDAFQLKTVMCSFDGGPAEDCSFPLELDFHRFGILAIKLLRSLLLMSLSNS